MEVAMTAEDEEFERIEREAKRRRAREINEAFDEEYVKYKEWERQIAELKDRVTKLENKK
jgi:polyhydroxyalkanoate synthesis regulator phasin